MAYVTKLDWVEPPAGLGGALAERVEPDLAIDRPLTVACWVYVNDFIHSSQHAGIQGFEGSSSGYAITTTTAATGTIHFSAYDATFGWRRAAKVAITDYWYHVIGTIDSGGNIDIFLNNVIGSGASGVGSIEYENPSVPNFQIGRHDSYVCDARIADYAVWNTEISANDRLKLAKGPMGAPLRVLPGNLLGYWPLTRYFPGQNTVIGDTFIDASGNGYHLTIDHQKDAGGASTQSGCGTYSPRPWPRRIYSIPAPTGEVNINMDALTLASAAQTLIVSPGAVTKAMDALTLASAAQQLDVVPITNIAMSALTGVTAAQALSVVPGATSVSANALSAVSAAQTLTVTPGAVSILPNALTLISGAQTLTVTIGNTIALDALTLATSAQTAQVVTGLVTIAVNVLTGSAAAQDLTVVPGTVTIPVDAVQAGVSAEILSVVPAGVAIQLDANTLTGSVGSLQVIPGMVTIAVDALSGTLAAQGVTIATGATSIPVSVLSAACSAETLTVDVLAEILISMGVLQTATSAPSLTIRGGRVAIGRLREIDVIDEDRDIALVQESRLIKVPEE